MSPDGEAIIRYLSEVTRARHSRQGDVDLSRRLNALKAFQHARLEATYADLLAIPRYSAAARFFLEDLYGPDDFAERDAQFARIVPALVRLFPADIVRTVAQLAELHALSEVFDAQMAMAISNPTIDAIGYRSAWRTVARREGRLRQIELTRSVGEALDGYTRKRGLRQTLRLLRTPARAAGLQALQQFLERGFDAFRQMRGAAVFLGIIEAREIRLIEGLFNDASESACSLDLVALATGGGGSAGRTPAQ